MNHQLSIFTVVYDTPEMLRWWIPHYAKLGVTRFFIAAGVTPDCDLLSECRRYAQDHWAAVIPFFRERLSTMEKMDAYRLLDGIANVGADHYKIYADLDEFHEYPAPLDEIIAECDRQNIWAIQGRFIDRIAADGSLAPLDASRPLEEQYPIGCRFTRQVLGGCDRKVMLLRGRAKLKGPGAHDTIVGRLDRWPIGSAEQYRVHHYKWNAGVIERGRTRMAVGVQASYSSEWRRFFDHLKDKGRIDLENPRLSASKCLPQNL